MRTCRLSRCSSTPLSPRRTARTGALPCIGVSRLRASRCSSGGLVPGAAAQDAPPNPKVVIETTEGDITVELFHADAPASVVNFLMYARDGYYNGTIFHRVIRNFMIQAGGYTAELTLKTDGLRGAILNEATNNLRNRRGTIAMARTAEPNSAHAQFFINTEDNRALDHKNKTAQGFGYAVFGEVTQGMDIVDRIERG